LFALRIFVQNFSTRFMREITRNYYTKFGKRKQNPCTEHCFNQSLKPVFYQVLQSFSAWLSSWQHTATTTCHI